MATNETTLNTPDGAMALYEATPDGEARGAVIVVQEAFGVNEHMKDVTRRFAAQGYHAVAPAYFHRGGGGCIDDYDNMDFGEIMKLFTGLTDDTVIADTDATLAHLHDAGFADGKIGIVGFCWGGRVTFLVALRRGARRGRRLLRRWHRVRGCAAVPAAHRRGRLPADPVARSLR